MTSRYLLIKMVSVRLLINPVIFTKTIFFWGGEYLLKKRIFLICAVVMREKLVSFRLLVLPVNFNNFFLGRGAGGLFVKKTQHGSNIYAVVMRRETFFSPRSLLKVEY